MHASQKQATRFRSGCIGVFSAQLWNEQAKQLERTQIHLPQVCELRPLWRLTLSTHSSPPKLPAHSWRRACYASAVTALQV